MAKFKITVSDTSELGISIFPEIVGGALKFNYDRVTKSTIPIYIYAINGRSVDDLIGEHKRHIGLLRQTEFDKHKHYVLWFNAGNHTLDDFEFVTP